MSAEVDYLLDTASEAEIAAHLVRCDADFVPPLSDRVAIRDYAKRIASAALRFEAWSGGSLIGLVAAYCNDRDKRIAYITSVSVLRAWTGKGIGSRLVGQCIERAKGSDMQLISLEVAATNTRAIKLYTERGFVVNKANGPFLAMNLYLTSREEHEQQP
jgi:ribosomal protein S18 acetylase RimI-like enzyme